MLSLGNNDFSYEAMPAHSDSKPEGGRKYESLALSEHQLSPGMKRSSAILIVVALSVMTYTLMVYKSFKDIVPQDEDGSVPWSSPDNDYYSKIDLTLTNTALKQKLHDLIYQKTSISYDAVWEAFADIYEHFPCDGDPNHIPDVYSKYCWTPKKGVPHGQCGSYKNEGDCFNREHKWPKAWFGGFDNGKGAQTDLFELSPSDGKVNAERGDLPLGNVDPSHISFTSTNGCKIGKCISKGYSGDCFELPDQLKGDFARTYFYLSVAYLNEWDCCDMPGVSKFNINGWMETELRNWHKKDPVDDLERLQNNLIYSNWQKNRNPFIDFPWLVDQIDDF